MNPYKCNSHPKSTSISLVQCLGCLAALKAKKDRMLEFIKEVGKKSHCDDLGHSWSAKELLKEIGEYPQDKDSE